MRSCLGNKANGPSDPSLLNRHCTRRCSPPPCPLDNCSASVSHRHGSAHVSIASQCVFRILCSAQTHCTLPGFVTMKLINPPSPCTTESSKVAWTDGGSDAHTRKNPQAKPGIPRFSSEPASLSFPPFPSLALFLKHFKQLAAHVAVLLTPRR